MATKQTDSVYETLKAVKVKELIKNKGGFSYLSWADAVDRLLSNYPEATWEAHEWDGSPYKETVAGGFVKVTVTVGDISRTQIHPILDHRNKTIPPDMINAFEVNTAIQRCLAKAISLHGLGIDIYRGEDIHDSEPANGGNGNQEQPNRSTTIPEPDNRLISDKQRKRMYAIAKQGGWEDANVKEMLARYEYTSSKDVTRADYEDICSVLEKGQTIYLDWRAEAEAKENATKSEGFPDIKDDLAPTFKGHQQELAGADITKDDIPF